jgi:hypothetical protein
MVDTIRQPDAEDFSTALAGLTTVTSESLIGHRHYQ